MNDDLPDGRGQTSAPGHFSVAEDQDHRRPPSEPDEPDASHEPQPPRTPRPLIERLGLAAVALVLSVLFGGVAAASWIGGEPFLAIMAAIGCAMTLWVGAITLRG